MAPQTPLLRRLAVPAGLSILIHALFAGLICLVRERPPVDHDSHDESRPGLAITLVSLTESRPALQPRTAPPPVSPALDPHIESEVVDPPAAFSTTIAQGPVEANPEENGGASIRSGKSEQPRMGRGLLCAPAAARRVVYLVDRSISMGPSGALATAVEEVAASLQSLSPQTLFQVIPYNRLAEPLELDGRKDLVEAMPVTVNLAIQQLDDILAGGATDHVQALFRALQMHPDVVFLVTDAADLAESQVTALRKLLAQGRTVLHVIELSRDRSDKPDDPLFQLSRQTGGTPRRVPPNR